MKLYLQSGVEFEVPYVLNGKLIVYQTGIATIAMTLLFDAEEIAKYAEGVPFFSDKYYMTKLFSTEYDAVFISIISLANLDVYKHKSAEFFLSMGLKISAKMKGRLAHNKGVKPAQETCAKISAHHKAAGIKPPNHKGKKRGPRSPETKAKISAAGKGRKHIPEIRAKISAAQKARWARKKAVENGSKK